MLGCGVPLLLGFLTAVPLETQHDLSKVDAVPSIRAPAPISVLTRDVMVEAARATARRSLTWDILRVLESKPVPLFAKWRDFGARDPRLFDPVRMRDATSLGVRTAGVSGPGATLALFGLSFEAAKALRLHPWRTVWKIGPMVGAGGVGILLGAKF